MTVPHYITGNELCRQPNRWVWLDTESLPVEHGKQTVHEWRLAVTCLDRRDSSTQPWKEPVWARHTDPEAMWASIGTYAIKSQRLMIVAHNVGFDARISHSFTALPSQGWELMRWQISDRSLMVKWQRDGCTMQFCDSTSWFPMSIEKLGGLVGTSKLPLPPRSATEDAWWARCETDVGIMRSAMLAGLAWMARNDLGNWAPTAGTSAWNAWRHRHMTHRVLVHDDVEARLAEREAAGAGRCEAWRHGQLPVGRWTEWDLPLAYASACIGLPLPVRLLSRVRFPSLKAIAARGTRCRWLVRADVTTEAPTLGVRVDDRWVWPVGRLTGWWWDTELELAGAHGATWKPIEAHRYQAAPALSQWARWIVDVVNDRTGAVSEVERAAAKVWARALIGRFGTRYRVWEDWGPATLPDTSIGFAAVAGSNRLGKTFSLAGRDLGSVEEVDGEQTAPAIMSAVMCEARLRLWGLMTGAGFEHVAYCDTDSVIVDNVGDARLRALSATGSVWGARPKGVWDSLTVLGPRQLVVGGGHRISGVSSGAERTSLTTWAGERFEGVEQSLAHGRPGGVLVSPTVWRVEGTDRRRSHLVDGSTEPFTFDMSIVG